MMRFSHVLNMGPLLLLLLLTASALGQGDLVQVAVATEKGPTNTGHCTCQVYTGWSEMKQYYTLKKLKMRIDMAEEVMEVMNFTTIFHTLENATARIATLEDNINKQAVAASVTELFALRKSVEHLVNLMEVANSSHIAQDDQSRLRAELDAVRQSADSLWARNPYRQRNDYQRQVNKLRERLSTCHRTANLSPFPGDDLPPTAPRSEGWCAGRGALKVGGPVTHLWEASHIKGMWFKDPRPTSNMSTTEIWNVVNKGQYNGYTSVYRMTVVSFPNYTSLISATGSTSVYRLSSLPLDGYGAVVYGNSLYYNNDRYLVRLDLLTKTIDSMRMAFAMVKYRASSDNTYLDINADESGLWAIYAVALDNKLVISKINPNSLLIEKTWKTDVLKTDVCAAFMVCGKMYTVYSCNSRVASAMQNYVYDTNTSSGSHVQYHVPSMYGSITQLTYNSRERVLFGWDRGHLVTYPLSWEANDG